MRVHYSAIVSTAKKYSTLSNTAHNRVAIR